MLAFTAAKMIVSEPLLDAVFDPPELLHARRAAGLASLRAKGGSGSFWNFGDSSRNSQHLRAAAN